MRILPISLSGSWSKGWSRSESWSSTLRGDITAFAATGEVVAVVEIKNRQALTAELAALLRRDLLTHGYVSRAPYFLLLSQDRGYLWGPSATNQPDAVPAAEFAMSDVIARYWHKLEAGERLRGSELQLLVLQWLQDLARSSEDTPQAEPERTLAHEGFLQAMRGSIVSADARL